MFARSVGENAVHGSDSDENALIEAQFHFSGREIFNQIFYPKFIKKVREFSRTFFFIFTYSSMSGEALLLK